MVDYARIERKFKQLAKNLAFLKSAATLSKEDFAANYEKILACERSLQICLEIVFDVADIILSPLKEIDVDVETDLLDILRQRNIISKELENALIQLDFVIDVILCEYLEDHNKMVYQLITNELGNFEQYELEIKKYLGE